MPMDGVPAISTTVVESLRSELGVQGVDSLVTLDQLHREVLSDRPAARFRFDCVRLTERGAGACLLVQPSHRSDPGVSSVGHCCRMNATGERV